MGADPAEARPDAARSDAAGPDAARPDAAGPGPARPDAAPAAAEPAAYPADTEPLEILGRIPTASNATFLAAIAGVEVVYKPIAGEKPLWDFPDGDLASREVAAYVVSEAFGWDIVPRTWLRDGPLGRGMVQLWQDVDEEQSAVDLVSSTEVPESGWRTVLEGSDERDLPVTLIHEDTAVLRRMAVFDVVANNADRKGAHILELDDGHRRGVDHGLTFHEEHKLRTVLWGWRGDELDPAEVAGLERVRTALYEGDLAERLGEFLRAREIDAFANRVERLLTARVFPEPHGNMPAVPWPLF